MRMAARSWLRFVPVAALLLLCPGPGLAAQPHGDGHTTRAITPEPFRLQPVLRFGGETHVQKPPDKMFFIGDNSETRRIESKKTNTFPSPEQWPDFSESVIIQKRSATPQFYFPSENSQSSQKLDNDEQVEENHSIDALLEGMLETDREHSIKSDYPEAWKMLNTKVDHNLRGERTFLGTSDSVNSQRIKSSAETPEFVLSESETNKPSARNLPQSRDTQFNVLDSSFSGNRQSLFPWENDPQFHMPKIRHRRMERPNQVLLNRKRRMRERRKQEPEITRKDTESLPSKNIDSLQTKSVDSVHQERQTMPTPLITQRNFINYYAKTADPFYTEINNRPVTSLNPFYRQQNRNIEDDEKRVIVPTTQSTLQITRRTRRRRKRVRPTRESVVNNNDNKQQVAKIVEELRTIKDEVLNVERQIENVESELGVQFWGENQQVSEIRDELESRTSEVLRTSSRASELFPRFSAIKKDTDSAVNTKERTNNVRQRTSEVSSADPNVALFETTPDHIVSLSQIRHEKHDLEKTKSIRRRRCQQQDLARKAYKAPIVVLAEAQSMSSARGRNYSVTFKIHEYYKGKENLIGDVIRLSFSNDTKRMNCESELSKPKTRLVKAQIRTSKRYFLFLEKEGRHTYRPVGVPVLYKQRQTLGRSARDQETQVRRVIVDKTVRDPIVSLVGKPDNPVLKGSNVTLICTVKGFPTPVITWKKDYKTVLSSKNVSIKYKRKRTTLKLRSVGHENAGQYRCVARAVDDKEVYSEYDLQVNDHNSNGEECNITMKESYCNNGGICFQFPSIGEYSCECRPGYKGARCDEKEVTEDSRYQKINCKQGMSPIHCS